MYMLEHQPMKERTFEPLRGKPVPAKKFDFDLEPLPDRIRKYLKGHYYFTDLELETSDWKWIPSESRLWMPISRRDLTTIGGVARTLSRSVTPKTLNYIWNVNAPLASYAMYQEKYIGNQTVIWLVEDQISAHRLSAYGEACALLGTNISDQLLIELGQHYEEVILALDPDAIDKALKLQKRMNPHIDTKVTVLKRDIKNMPPNEVFEVVARTTHNVVVGH